MTRKTLLVPELRIYYLIVQIYETNYETLATGLADCSPTLKTVATTTARTAETSTRPTRRPTSPTRIAQRHDRRGWRRGRQCRRGDDRRHWVLPARCWRSRGLSLLPACFRLAGNVDGTALFAANTVGIAINTVLIRWTKPTLSSTARTVWGVPLVAILSHGASLATGESFA